MLKSLSPKKSCKAFKTTGSSKDSSTSNKEQSTLANKSNKNEVEPNELNYKDVKKTRRNSSILIEVLDFSWITEQNRFWGTKWRDSWSVIYPIFIYFFEHSLCFSSFPVLLSLLDYNWKARTLLTGKLFDIVSKQNRVI